MNLSNYACDNQLSIFEYLEAKSDPPVLLQIGQNVYKVIRGDVIKMYVYDEKSWLCGDNERGYRLKEHGGCYDCAWNRSIGVNVFTSKEQAYEVAERYLKENHCIRKENIKPIKTVAYSYIRECDNRTMTAFYSLLDNEMVYIKEFMTFQHICKDVKKAIELFMEQQEFKYVNQNQIELEPEFKNMYACKNHSDWCYAEARFNSY